MQNAVNQFGQPVGPPVPGWAPVPFPEPVSLEGRFCRLERLDPDRHARALYQANANDSDGRNWTYLAYGPFPSFEVYQAWVRESAVKYDPQFFAIIDLALQRPVGVCSYLRIDPDNGTIEVGHLCFSPLLQQKPAATEAMYLMMKHAFGLGYRRYEWKCDSLNGPSRRAALRLGFSFEGIFRQAVVVKGRNRDTVWFSVIDREWPSLQQAFEEWLAPANFDERGQQKMSLSAMTANLLTQRG